MTKTLKGKKWVRSREYGDGRESYKFTFYTGGTQTNLYMNYAVWFRKGGRGVQCNTVYWRCPYELDLVELKKELINFMSDRYGVHGCISVIRALSLYRGKRVYQWEISYRRDERPTADEMQRWFEELDVYDIQRHAYAPVARTAS